MSLTGKLILGFLFALVLQVVQMLVSGYVTSCMQQTSATMSAALQANIAVQRSLDVVYELQSHLVTDLDRPVGADLEVYGVFVEELQAQARRMALIVNEHAPVETRAVMVSAMAIASQLHEVEKAKSKASSVGETAQDADSVGDALAFLDDSLSDALAALQRIQVVIGSIGSTAVAEEKGMRDVPWQTGMIITLCGVVIMAAFVTWFSRQLVIPIERAWAQLELRVEDRTAELGSTVAALETEIVERQRVEQQKEDLNRQLLAASRKAGMAELANGVLHNVGNVLNSVNVSANLLLKRLHNSRVEGLSKAVALMRAHDHELAHFLMESPKGRKLPGYLDQLGSQLMDERDALLSETKDLSSYIDHMKEIVHRQQAYASVSGATSMVDPKELVDDVLRMHGASLSRHEIDVESHIACVGECEMDRSRVMQILMNLVKNAKQAIAAAGRDRGRLQIRVEQDGDSSVRFSVVDDGIGIAEGQLTRIFAHGFTTKDDGHGFGLHHSANAATEMGGHLSVQSEGEGMGSTFVLELPLSKNEAVMA